MFHFSERAGIARFEPRAVAVPSVRPVGREWLNGPLVWAVERQRAPLYLFPRDCPRLLAWATELTLEADRRRWLGSAIFAAWIEIGWVDRLQKAELWRYRVPAETFEDLGDAGMWVSREAVTPTEATRLDRLPVELAAHNVDLRIVDSLIPFADLWKSTLHVSGVRLRNACR